MIARLKHVARRVWYVLWDRPDPARLHDGHDTTCGVYTSPPSHEWTVVDHEETLIHGRMWRRARFANGEYSAYRLVTPEPCPSPSP